MIRRLAGMPPWAAMLFAVLGLEARTVPVSAGANLRDLITASESGDTLLLADGNYASPGYLSGLRFQPSHPLVIRAKESRKARFASGASLHFHDSRGIVLQGIEITSLAGNAGLIQVSSQSDSIWIRDCHVHHAPLEADCLKTNQAKNLFVEDCWFHDPGARENGDGMQETLDYLDIDGGTIVRCLFTGGTSRQFINAKGGSRNILIEGNILVGHDGSSGDAAIILGGWSTREFIRGDFEGVNLTARNNIVIGSKTGAMQVSNVDGAYIHNNLFHECEGYGEYRGLIYISPGNGVGMGNGSRKVRLMNNIFHNQEVPMPPEVATLVGNLEDFQTGHNLYYNGGKAVPSQGPYNPNSEAGVILADPRLPVPAGTSYAERVLSLAPQSAGPWTDAGVNVEDLPLLSLGLDVLGFQRPVGKPDMGPYEWSGASGIASTRPPAAPTARGRLKCFNLLGRRSDYIFPYPL